MSEFAEEIIRELGIDVDEDDLIDQLDAIEEIEELEEDAANRSTKLILGAAQGTIVAKFHPGPKGTGECHKAGTGAFTSSKRAPGRGSYKVKVGRFTVKVYNSRGGVVWKGHGLQKGISGTWNITLK